MPLITLFFFATTPQQIKEQDQHGLEQIQHAQQWKKAHKATDAESRLKCKQDADTEWQQKHQCAVAQIDVSQGLCNPVTLHLIKVAPIFCQPTTNLHQPVGPPSRLPKSPEPSKSPDPDNHRPTKKQCASPVNYFEPAQ
ncbi:hypothetical protein RSOLAG22IIIB_04159 [Rhizoctonia solani]|uniref:Uncharacterized protein n=1 Tax=Rhizoctonia solani TaxID=456999 RepID=A0A0K6FW93_9AGAM|nr:hypothetical protein RSOLAG22IIIB_04159 [Rhizoctonia solani]